MPPRLREVFALLKRCGYLYKNTVGDHHHFEHPANGHKITVAGSLGDELSKGSWHNLQKRLGLK